MSVPHARTVVFDLDGTLADTSRDLIEAANRIFTGLELDVRLDPVADRSIAFKGGRALLGLGLSRLFPQIDCSEDIDRYYPDYLDAYDRNIAEHTRIYEGVDHVLEDLQQDGWCLAVCTNKPEYLARKLLDILGLTRSFRAIVGADTYAYRKPDPRTYYNTVSMAGGSLPHSFMVGDSHTDMMTATNAKVPFMLFVEEAGLQLSEETCKASQFTCYRDLPEKAEQLWTTILSCHR